MKECRPVIIISIMYRLFFKECDTFLLCDVSIADAWNSQTLIWNPFWSLSTFIAFYIGPGMERNPGRPGTKWSILYRGKNGDLQSYFREKECGMRTFHALWQMDLPQNMKFKLTSSLALPKTCNNTQSRGKKTPHIFFCHGFHIEIGYASSSLPFCFRDFLIFFCVFAIMA